MSARLKVGDGVGIYLVTNIQPGETPHIVWIIEVLFRNVSLGLGSDHKGGVGWELRNSEVKLMWIAVTVRPVWDPLPSNCTTLSTRSLFSHWEEFQLMVMKVEATEIGNNTISSGWKITEYFLNECVLLAYQYFFHSIRSPPTKYLQWIIFIFSCNIGLLVWIVTEIMMLSNNEYLNKLTAVVLPKPISQLINYILPLTDETVF